MPHLGVLAQVHTKAATEVFEKDCMIYLGTAVCPVGRSKKQKEIMHYRLDFPDGRIEQGNLLYGRMKLIRLGVGEKAKLLAEPTRDFELGAGKGKKIQQEIFGGTVGIILDGRGRPLLLPEDTNLQRQNLKQWILALDVYPDRAWKGT